jgi:hypothetical protein
MGALAPGSAHSRPSSTLVEIFWHTFLFILVRSPCNNLKHYDSAFWDFNNGGPNPNPKKWNNVPKIVATFIYASYKQLKLSNTMSKDG